MSHIIELSGTSGIFTYKLDRWYRLEGEWEVALAQIVLPTSLQVEIEYRPTATSNPEYVYDDGEYMSIRKQILPISSEREHSRIINELGVYLVKLFTKQVINYKYNTAMEKMFIFLTNDLQEILNVVKSNIENIQQSYLMVLDRIASIRSMYKSEYIKINDGTLFKTKPGFEPYYNNIKLVQNNGRLLVSPVSVHIDLINPDFCLRSIAATQHDFGKLQYYRVTKTFFDSIRVEIKEPIKRPIQFQNESVYMRIQLKKIK
jgi:hypothetical protein